MISLDSMPRFDADQALAVALESYGLSGRPAALPSERDQNFLIETSAGGRVVMKIANRDDTPELLDFQHVAMRRVAAKVPNVRVQQLVRTRAGADLAEIRNPASDARHLVRVLTWVDGDVLSSCRIRSAALYESIGIGIAKIDAAFEGFTHPAMHRLLQWDLRHAARARAHAHLLPPARRRRVERLFDAWAEIDWSVLPHGVIHGDANDHNVLVANGRLFGLLDFGDMVYSATVCDLAIALAYTMLEEPAPLAAATATIRGYCRFKSLTEPEQRALFPLVLARLAMSVCYSAHNRARNPEDFYQVVSEEPAWRLLDALEPWPGEALYDAVSAARAG